MSMISVLLQHHAGPTGGVLICKTKDGAWEFPNGTIRTNETEPEAAERVIWEELGVKAVVGKLAMIGRKKPEDGYVEHFACGNITHNTNSKDTYHYFYEAVNKWQTEPKSDKYVEMKYVPAAELAQYGFEGDDQNFMAKFDPYVNPEYIPDVRMY